MKHWKETKDVLDQALELAAAGRHAALATVVGIEGSAYRRPGAKLLIADDGAMSGGVSGGCLESDVREVALGILTGDGAPRLLHYDTGADEDAVWGLGLGCDGAVDVFVQPLTRPEQRPAIERALTLLAEGRTFALVTVLDGPGAGTTLVRDEEGHVTAPAEDLGLVDALPDVAGRALARGRHLRDRIGETQVFAELLRPPPHLVIVGGGTDAEPLAAYGVDAGFRVTVVDHREAYLAPERFPAAARLVVRRATEGLGDLPADAETYVVIKMHALEHDTEWARRYLESPAPYVGLLGPRARTGWIRERVAAAGGNRVFGPVGLDVGAEGPEQIAVSILAELLAVHAGREPRHLRDREGAVHAG